MKIPEIIAYLLGFGLLFLFGFLLNIVPHVDGSIGINWVAGASLGWVFGWLTATLIYERRKRRNNG